MRWESDEEVARCLYEVDANFGSATDEDSGFNLSKLFSRKKANSDDAVKKLMGHETKRSFQKFNRNKRAVLNA